MSKAIDSKIAAIGCIVCKHFGWFTPAGIHHIRKLATSKKRSRAPKIPLCSEHHQNGGYGIALHAGEKKFEENYGTVLGMLEEVNKILGIDQQKESTK